MNGQSVWGLKVAVYLFAAGVGAGTYAVGAVAQLFGGEWSAVAALSIPLGPLLVAPATLFLVWDLGRPAGFLRAARRPATSWISRGVLILSAFLALTVMHAALTVWPLDALGAAGQVAFSLAGGLLTLLTIIYTGLLLGAVRPIPFWSTPVLPILFLVSSLSTGIMATDLGLTVVGHPSSVSLLTVLRSADLVLLGLEAIVIAVYLSVGHATAAARASTALLTTGAFATRFWLGVVLAGVALPFLIQAAEMMWPGPAAIAVGSSVLGLLGALMLRHVVIAGGVKAPLNAAGFLVPAR